MNDQKIKLIRKNTKNIIFSSKVDRLSKKNTFIKETKIKSNFI